MSVIQFIQTSPDQLKEELQTSFDLQFKELKELIQQLTSENRLLSREEAAKYLQVDLSTLWRWTKDGDLTSYGLGNRVYYKKSEIDHALLVINKQ